MSSGPWRLVTFGGFMLPFQRLFRGGFPYENEAHTLVACYNVAVL
jgi:hypothetical protein